MPVREKLILVNCNEAFGQVPAERSRRAGTPSEVHRCDDRARAPLAASPRRSRAPRRGRPTRRAGLRGAPALARRGRRRGSSHGGGVARSRWRSRLHDRHHRRAGRWQVLAHRSARRCRALARRFCVGARRRPIEPAYRRCHPRRSRPHGDARHRSRRLHPLDGDPRAARRPRGSHATGDPSARRQRDAVDRGGDGWRRPGGDRHRRRDRHHRGRRQPGLGRRSSGEQGRTPRSRRRVRREQGGSRRTRMRR